MLALMPLAGEGWGEEGEIKRRVPYARPLSPGPSPAGGEGS
jgi:hypothetical protein